MHRSEDVRDFCFDLEEECASAGEELSCYLLGVDRSSCFCQPLSHRVRQDLLLLLLTVMMMMMTIGLMMTCDAQRSAMTHKQASK